MINLGYKTYQTAKEIAEAEKEFIRLKKLGHAIVFHEEFESGNRVLLGASSMHYLTCNVCREQRRRDEESKKNKADKNSSAV